MSASTPQRSPRRIGLFGGTFDPVHDAHVALARAALQQLGLDELRWIPTGQPWYKNTRIAAACHRIAMVALAIEGEPRFSIDVRETERSGPTYTLDTVIELQAEDAARARSADAAAWAPAEWFFIIGQDQLAKLHTWHGWQALIGRVTLAVAARDGEPVTIGPALEGAPLRIVRIDLPPMHVSSTEIRARLLEGGDLAGLVPDAVAGYIARHGLYALQRADRAQPHPHRS